MADKVAENSTMAPAINTGFKLLPDGTFAQTIASAPANIDSTGTTLLPDSLSHVYGYTNSLLTSDTATDGTHTWVKTFTYTGTQLTGESKWVKQ